MMEVHVNKTKVSVCVVTYNQEKYIRQCLESILEQKTNFNFEVIVGDDRSTDNTRAIIREFVETYPRVVKPIFHERNIGAYKNFVHVHNQAIGEYIAHMDGDDYALPGKLQVQADCLDNNKEANIVWHAVKIIDVVSGKARDDYLPRRLYPEGGLKKQDLLAIGSIGCHSSKMYRAKCRDYVKADFEFIDFYTDVQHIGEGKGIYINDILGVYRANLGVASRGNKVRKMLINNLSSLSLQYPDCRSKIGSHALRLFIGDLIKRRSTIRLSWGLLRDNFSTRIFYDFLLISLLLKFGNRTK